MIVEPEAGCEVLQEYCSARLQFRANFGLNVVLITTAMLKSLNGESC